MLVKTMECIVIWDLCIHRLQRVTGKVNTTPCCLGSAVRYDSVSSSLFLTEFQVGAAEHPVKAQARI